MLYPSQADRGRLEVPARRWGWGGVPSCRNLHGREGRATHWGQGDPVSNRSTAPSVMERGRASVKARRRELVQPGNESGQFLSPLLSPGSVLPRPGSSSPTPLVCSLLAPQGIPNRFLPPSKGGYQPRSFGARRGWNQILMFPLASSGLWLSLLERGD